MHTESKQTQGIVVSFALSSYSSKNTSVLIPVQQRVLPILRFRLFDISPPPQELLMRQDSGELAGDSSIHQLHDVEVGGKQNVEIALMYL
jgi:hypothetical protein